MGTISGEDKALSEVNYSSKISDPTASGVHYYNQSGLNSYTKRDSSDEVKRIDILIKALGTMVIVQDIQSDPNNIGQIINRGSIQVPILQDTNRKVAEDKLVQLIKSL